MLKSGILYSHFLGKVGCRELGDLGWKFSEGALGGRGSRSRPVTCRRVCSYHALRGNPRCTGGAFVGGGSLCLRQRRPLLGHQFLPRQEEVHRETHQAIQVVHQSPRVIGVKPGIAFEPPRHGASGFHGRTRFLWKDHRGLVRFPGLRRRPCGDGQARPRHCRRAGPKAKKIPAPAARAPLQNGTGICFSWWPAPFDFGTEHATYPVAAAGRYKRIPNARALFLHAFPVAFKEPLRWCFLLTHDHPHSRFPSGKALSFLVVFRGHLCVT